MKGLKILAWEAFRRMIPVWHKLCMSDAADKHKRRCLAFYEVLGVSSGGNEAKNQ